MAETSTLGYALLGLLARAPLSGWDLAQRLDMPAGYFWSAGHSQIYPELKKLERAKLVKHTKVEQRDRPDKKVYALTAAGRRALRRWVTTPLAPAPKRDELMLRVYSLWLADPADAVAFVRDQEAVHRRRIAEYETHQADVEQHWAAELDDPRSPRFATYATLRRGLGYERELADWCAWLASRITS